MKMLHFNMSVKSYHFNWHYHDITVNKCLFISVDWAQDFSGNRLASIANHLL